MFLHLPSALASCVLAASVARASYLSADQGAGQVVLNQPGSPPPTHERMVDQHGRELYDGYSVVRFDAETVDKRKELVRIGQLLNLDIWAHHASSVDMLLPPSLASSTAELVQASSSLLSFSAQPFIPSIQPLIDQTYPEPVADSLWGGRHRKHRPSPSPIPVPPPTNDSRLPLETSFHDSYHRLEEIYTFMEDLQEGWPSLVTIVDIGTSSEGRAIKGLRVGVAPANSTTSDDEDDDEDGAGRKKEFVVISGQHGREWISVSTTLYFAHWLLTNVHDKDAVKHLLEEIDFTIIPVVNVDGYEYSFEHSRLWRKTRFDSGSALGCKGIDANRGWGYQWSELDHLSEDSLAGVCSDNYPGKFPFEAPEVRAVADYLQTQKVIAYLDIHSYGQLLMFPFSYSCERFPPDAEDLYEALLGATKSLRAVRGTEYMTGQACELVFRAPGDSIDFAYGSQDIKWSFSMELPDEGTYAFLLPPREIRPVGEETTEALFYLAKFVEKKENGGKFL